MIKLHEYMLNSIYSLNRIKIKNRQLSFKVVDIQFQDEQFCRTNINHGKTKSSKCVCHLMLISVGCKQWRPEQDAKMLDYHARSNHEDVCLSFLFTSHSLGDTLGEQVETVTYFGAFNIYLRYGLH